jgi:2-polyprenyl-6-methoxyphenol hydroxylase-like FAD-dependent oxidoreductase
MRKGIDADALVIGAGPAGAATAILLKMAGWRVILVEKSSYPRQKVCGECLSAASLALLDQLGVGAAVRDRAGPELHRVAWMSGDSILIADLPACTEGPYRYGRALGRDQLDAILVKRAIELGVMLIQPGKVRSVTGELGDFECDIILSVQGFAETVRLQESVIRRVPIVIDAHGSWENGPEGGPQPASLVPHRGSDLLGFKASFVNATLPQGLLPVLSFRGGYGGLVIAEDRRLTLAGCIRRDTLARWRAARRPGTPAGAAFELYLRASCRGVRESLAGALRSGPWLSIGPLRPQIRLRKPHRLFSVGNAAGETHPLIGEGMSMAVQSAFLLASQLAPQPAHTIDATRALEIHRAYRSAWCKAFALRQRLAAIYAHIAMRPLLSLPATRLLRNCPQLLTAAAHLAGKARKAAAPSILFEGIV